MDPAIYWKNRQDAHQKLNAELSRKSLRPLAYLSASAKFAE